MSAPIASTSSSPLVSFTQDIDYSQSEGYKQFKLIYQKNARCTRNDPHGSYLTALEVYTAAKSSSMLMRDMASLSFQDFITSSSIMAHCCLKRLSLTPYYTAQMKRYTQKWDCWDNQGTGMEAIDFCQQLVSVVRTSLYHSMANVQMTVSCSYGPTFD